MTDITYSVVKGKVVLHKDGANFALTLPQIEQLKQQLPEMATTLEQANASGKNIEGKL